MSKKWIAYIVLILISIASLIIFIKSSKNYEVLEKTISVDEKEIYIVKEETNILGKSISEWGIFISTFGVLSGLISTFIEYSSNKKRIEQEKGAEIAKMFATEIVEKMCIIIHVLSFSKLNKIIKKIDTNLEHTYSYFECTNFDKNEIRKVYGDDIYEKYILLRKEKELQAIYTRVLKSENEPNYSSKDIKKELEYLNNLKNTKSKRYKAEKKIFENIKINKENYILPNTVFPHRFESLIYNTLNELEYLCMYISSKAANSEFIYQSLHQVFLRGIRILAIEISSQNTDSVNKVYTNIIHVYNDWIKRYSKAQKQEEKNIKKSNNILNPKVKTI